MAASFPAAFDIPAPARIATARDAADMLSPLFADCSGETLVTAHVDEMGWLLKLVRAPDGGAADVLVPVRAILGDALRLGSAAILIAHNHPSGDPSPSMADRLATRRLADAARLLGITLRDHLIFAGGQSRSFRQMGLL